MLRDFSANIPRQLGSLFGQTLDEGGKVILLYGPRQAGKTTLVKSLLADRAAFHVLTLTGDDPGDRRELVGRDGAALARLVHGYDVLFIDEAQRVSDIGLVLKLLHDAHPKLRIIATGSSSFELAAHATEPLTGRARTFTLFPIAVAELLAGMDRRGIERELDDFLVHGLYPEICKAPSRDEKRRALKELTESYLYKDVIEFGGIRHADRIHDLLRLLAFQVGSEVSIAELGTSLGLGRDTVDRYIDVLEKAFVVFRQRGYARNLRKEVTKMDKIYFYDVGVRNMVIGNLADPAHRDDIGNLWENFLVAERRKILAYRESLAQSWFWRLRTGAELDYLEEEDGKLHGYEFKYGEKKPRAPDAWEKTYPDSSYLVVNRNTWLDFVSGEKGESAITKDHR
jgi:predicted AAA+ superfamily ATPase